MKKKEANIDELSEEAWRLWGIASRAFDVVDTLTRLLTSAKAEARKIQTMYNKACLEKRRRERKERANG